MTACDQMDLTMGSKLYSYLERKPANYDVAFAVGPDKIIVKALKVILKASSAAFEKKFEETWEESVLKDGEGIPLPNCGPDDFKLFIRLTITDEWSVEALKELNLPANRILNLLSICQRFEMVFAIRNLQKLFQEFATTSSFFKTDEFLTLSKSNLKTVLSRDDIPLDENGILDSVCRWAKSKFDAEGLEPTGKNYRELLGDTLLLIRFPTMTFSDFHKAMKLNNLLTNDEIVEVFKFIGMDNEEKKMFDSSHLPFETKLRISRLITEPPADCLTLRATTLFKPGNDSNFECDGSVVTNYFMPTNRKISLLGFGFLPPANTDAFYNVTIKIKRISQPNTTTLIKKETKSLFAQEGQVFYFILNQPVTIEPVLNEYNKNYYSVNFSLKGPSTQAMEEIRNYDWQTLSVDGTEFCLWWITEQLAEILFYNL